MWLASMLGTSALLLTLICARPVVAQQLELKRAEPRIAWSGCAPVTAPPTVPAAQRQEAEALAASATQAAILGNNVSAAEQLVNAARLDPGSAAIAYRLARTHEELGQRNEALASYCRFLALAPDVADAAEARERISALAERGGVPANAAQAFKTGIAHFDGGRLSDAEAAFDRAFAAAPNWSDAIYNRGVVRLALGMDDVGTADLRRYLELSPGAPDLGAIVDVLALNGGVKAAAPNPSLVFASGVLLPGLGHFTSGRPAAGALVMGVAGAALATGLLIKQTDVACLSPPVDGRCPPDQVLREDVSHPYLVPAIAVGVGVGLFGAIDAFRGARRRNADAAASRNGSKSPHTPTLELGRNGVRLDLIRFRF
jgi:tetratricopeptide (TPR) repeat protein